MITIVNQVSSAWFDNSAGGKEVRLGSGSALGEKGEKIDVGKKKFGERSEPGGSLGRGIVTKPGDMPLMPPIRPPAINLSFTILT